MANLCRESYLTSDQISSNVVCITFGLPLVNIASVMETAQQIPVLNTILHNVLMENDILPKILTFLQNGFGAKMTITTDDQVCYIINYNLTACGIIYFIFHCHIIIDGTKSFFFLNSSVFIGNTKRLSSISKYTTILI